MPAGPTKTPPTPWYRSPLARAVAPVLGGILVIAVVGAALWGVAVYVTDRQREDAPGFEAPIGDEAFEVGDYERLLARIQRDGAPLLFPDLLVGGDLDIYVNHVGPGPQEGWLAFAARRPGSDRSCTLRWERDATRFVDPCTGQAYGPDGAGLPAFPTEITESGDLVVHLRPPGAAATTTTRSTVVIIGTSATD